MRRGLPGQSGAVGRAGESRSEQAGVSRPEKRGRVGRPGRTSRRFFENWIERASTHSPSRLSTTAVSGVGNRERSEPEKESRTMSVSAWRRRIGRPDLQSVWRRLAANHDRPTDWTTQSQSIGTRVNELLSRSDRGESRVKRTRRRI